MRFAPRRGRLMFAFALALTLLAVGIKAATDQRTPEARAQNPPPLLPVAIPAGPTGPTRAPGAALPPAVSARGAVVLDADSGQTLFEKNAYQPLPPASTTKILTALLALQHLDPHARVVARFSHDELDPDSTVMGLRPGDELTVEDLLYGLMLPSGNDAALVLAKLVGGSEQAFSAMMNRFAANQGLSSSTFVNPHGLHDPAHLTSAYDIARIARLAMRDPRFRAIVGAETWTVSGARTYTVRNKNPFLAAYPGADGVKIGWTEDAGATIVASATRDGHRVIVALLDTGDRVAESATLLDWAFASYRWPEPQAAGR